MKMGSKHKFVTFCLNDDLTEIVVEKAVQDATYSDFIAALPEVCSMLFVSSHACIHA